MTLIGSSGEFGVLTPGTLVGHYSIIEKIGEGGQAVVYRARDLSLEREVALKTPRCEFVSPAACAQLLKEARAASRLSHPCIVPVYEVFEDQGRPWFAMDLIDGWTLRAVLSQHGALSCEDVARYGEMLADALRAAHARQVLHRDVTPRNIFITADGRLLLADFGLASVPPSDEGMTRTTNCDRGGGTLGYMSPEQMMGREVGAASDIFSAGVVMFEMAVGERPFKGGSLGEVLDAMLNRPFPPTSAEGVIPPDLEHIIRKALARRQDERYTSAEEMFVDLRAVRRRLESNGAEAVLVSRRPGRSRGYVLGGLASIVVLTVLAAGWSVLNRPPALPQSVPFRVTAGSGWEAEAAVSPAGTDVVYTAEDEAGNTDIWLVDAKGGNPIRLTDDPAVERSPAWFPDGSAIAFVVERNGLPSVWKVPRLGGQAPTLIVAGADSPAISPDGTRIAFTRPDASGKQRIVVAPLGDTSKATTLTTDRDGLWNHESPAWSPDGRVICYADHADLWTVPADGGPAARLTKDGQADFDPAWSPDGKWVYFSSMRGETTAIWRVGAPGGTPERVTMGSGPEREPSVSKDGLRLAYSTYSLNSNIVIRETKTGKEYQFGGERQEVLPTFAPDGSAVAFVSDQMKSPPDLWVQPLTPDGVPNGRARRLTDHPGSAAYPSFSPDGRWIAYHRALNGQRDIWIIPAGGGEPVQFTDDPATDIHPSWSPDQRQIAFVSERGGGSHIWVAPVAEGQPAGPARPLTTGPLLHDAPTWSPDSSTVAYVATDAAGARDVWLADARSTGLARQLTHGADAGTVQWTGARGPLLVSGSWGSTGLRLMSVDLDTGQAIPVRTPELFGERSDSSEFALSRDGRLMAIVRQAARGDIWVLEARRGHF